MPTIVEGTLSFDFPDRWSVSKYDEWSYYRNQFNKVCGGVKAVDLLALAPDSCFWLVEIKDYRRHVRTKAVDMADEFAAKVRDTMAGMVGAKFCANNNDEQDAARQALHCQRLRLVLHVEQPAQHSILFPRAIDPADVLQRLKQLVKAIDPHPSVVYMNNMKGLPWAVTATT